MLYVCVYICIYIYIKTNYPKGQRKLFKYSYFFKLEPDKLLGKNIFITHYLCG